MPNMEMTFTLDTSELLKDIERIESGELTLPIVSAVKIVGIKDEIIIYLGDE